MIRRREGSKISENRWRHLWTAPEWNDNESLIYTKGPFTNHLDHFFRTFSDKILLDYYYVGFMEPLLITSPHHMVCEWPHNQSNLGISVIYTKEGSTIFKHFFKKHEWCWQTKAQAPIQWWMINARVIKKCKCAWARYTFSLNHKIHKSSCSLCFWAPDPLIDRF